MNIADPQLFVRFDNQLEQFIVAESNTENSFEIGQYRTDRTGSSQLTETPLGGQYVITPQARPLLFPANAADDQ